MLDKIIQFDTIKLRVAIARRNNIEGMSCCQMKRLFTVLSIILAFALVSCAPRGEPEAASEEAMSSAREPGKLRIVATLFPQYDFARTIAGDKADVTLLLPPGVESHTFDPTLNDIFLIHDSDVFLYTGADMEPWAQRVISGAPSSTAVVNVCENIERFDEAHGEDDDNDEHDAEHKHGYDPHIWLDLRKAAQMVDNIADALCEKDAKNATQYRENAAEYKRELLRLDSEFEAMIRSAKRDTLVFGGRFAYQYFLERYGLHYVSVYDTCSSASEPSVARVVQVIDYIKNNSIPCIYYEEFADPKIARSISNQTDATLELFSTAHNVTKNQFASGVTFIDIMRQNFNSVEKGLNS